MRKLTLALALCLTTLFACNSQVRESSKSKNNTAMDSTKVVKSEEEWKKILTPEQYAILREKGTDRPFTGKYYLTTDKGTYLCAACGAELFTSDMKFESSCGWPSFDKEMLGGKVKTQTDYTHGMVRTEILCAKCGGHLGHLFDDGPTETGKRYCVNSTSLNFVKAK
ncbi:MAG TPA: peptide-methionine (R)-S-oxide reductase MsrB [Cyclobacteriaceae bacterium]|nr:peptide-methionine (R)-S-oxide reductase MsrB [Cyclobacteriaceae bacterium]